MVECATKYIDTEDRKSDCGSNDEVFGLDVEMPSEGEGDGEAHC